MKKDGIPTIHITKFTKMSIEEIENYINLKCKSPSKYMLGPFYTGFCR